MTQINLHLSPATIEDISAPEGLVNSAYRGDSSRIRMDNRSQPVGWYQNRCSFITGID